MKLHMLPVLAMIAAPLAAQDTPLPAEVGDDEFRGLSWLEGRWVGSGGGFDAFYEAFRFVDDATLEQTTYPDDSFAEPDGRSLLRFQGGQILKYREGRVESVLTRLDGDTLRFERVPPGEGGFSWIRVNDGEWQAILERPGGNPVVYTMRRIE